MTEPTTTTVVLGLGNVLMSDEGVGVRAVQRLLHDARVPSSVTLVDGGTLGLELLSYTAAAERLLVLDAVDVDAPAGTLVRLDEASLAALPGGATVHQLGVADVLAAARMMGREPREVIVLGVQPASLALGTSLSTEVEAALDRLVDAAVSQLIEWNRPHDERSDHA